MNFAPATSDTDRLKIVLACYNGGIGHVVDARNLARKYGANPDSWEVVADYLTKKSDPQYAHDDVVKNGRFIGKTDSGLRKQRHGAIQSVLSQHSPIGTESTTRAKPIKGNK